MMDHRAELYQELHKRHARDEAARTHSAMRVLQTVFTRFKPASVLDVGCGVGLWLSAATRLGVPEVRGIEGPWLRDAVSESERSNIVIHDLEQDFDLDRRFDLVVSIEVAEHLSPAVAARFIASLVRHSDMVLFSAAIPGQGGTGHLNEQFPTYWANHFAALDYRPVDFVRPSIWADSSVQVWLRQNVIPFASSKLIENHSWMASVVENAGPLSIVHPELFVAVQNSVRRQSSS